VPPGLRPVRDMERAVAGSRVDRRRRARRRRDSSVVSPALA